MSGAPLPFVLDGVTARLFPGLCRSLARGPGQMGRGGAAGLAVWDAGGGLAGLDLLAQFWEYDAGQIDWLTGFLCDPVTIAWFAALADPPEAEEEAEELFARASMNTLESTVNEDIR